MYRTAVKGILNAQNIKSEMHSDNTKAVVACARNLGFNMSATTVIKLPVTQQEHEIIYVRQE